MKNFIRWYTPNTIVGYDTTEVFACDLPEDYQYLFPIKSGDVLYFQADSGELAYRASRRYGIGLISGCKNVSYNVGEYSVNEDGTRLYFKVTFPDDLLEGECYRLLFYEHALSVVSDWSTVSSACENDEKGNPTGYQLLTQQRETLEGDRVPVATSSFFRFSAYHRSTKVLRYKGTALDWDYDYKSFPEFYHQIRLHLTIGEAEAVIGESIYRQTNGVFRRSKSTVDKRYNLHTDYFDEGTHDALINALRHDILLISGREYFAEGAYEQEHIETMDNEDRYHRKWKAEQKLFLQGHNQTNRMCALNKKLFKIYSDQYTDVYA